MEYLVPPVALALLALGCFWYGKSRALALAGGRPSRLHSLPVHHGAYLAVWCAVPGFVLGAAWLLVGPEVIQQLVLAGLPAEVMAAEADRLNLYYGNIVAVAEGTQPADGLGAAALAAVAHYQGLRVVSMASLVAALVAVAAAGFAYARHRITLDFRARHKVERALTLLLVACSVVAVLTTLGIILSLLFEAIRFFAKVSPIEFFFGLTWSPQTALRADQAVSGGAFGAVPLFAGTLFITLLSLAVAAPLGLLAAIYLSEYASQAVRTLVKPVLEVLAGIPTVVYGFFAALTVAPFLRDSGASVGLLVSPESALACGLVLGIQLVPYISSLSDDVINAVPQSLRDGSYGLGATKSETIRNVILPAALPGIVASLILAVSKAIGETMIVVMAAGLAANLTLNPLESTTTVTVQIKTLLVGDQEFDSAKTLAAFALGLTLFFVTLALNVFALRIVQKYREKYD